MENNKRTFQSFQQIRREVKHEGFDTSKTLTYVQALENVKVALVPFAEKELQEEAKRKKDNIVIEKNKTYLRQRFAIMTERVMNIVAEQGIRVSGMTVDEFVSVAVSELEGHDILEDAFRDDEVTDIYVYCWDKIFVEKNGENVVYPKKFRNEKHYEMFIERLTREAGGRLDPGSNKICDYDLW